MRGSQPFIGQFVGIVPPAAFGTLWYPKQLLLMFDRLAIDLGTKGLDSEERSILQAAMPEINSLVQLEMLTLLSGLLASKSDRPSRSELVRARSTIVRGSVTPERLNALELRKKGIDAVPLMRSGFTADADAVADRDAVIRITLREFPAPSDATPWESIQDFRKDQSARDKFWELKRWINKTGKAGLKEYEVMDELGSLMSDYNQCVKLHKMKTQASVLEVLVTTTVGVAEDLVKFKWSSAAKSLFKVGRENIALMEDERSMPGKEVAYIADAWKYFQR
jgi:hypothetical protein